MTELPGRLREIVGYAHVVPGEPRYERDVTGRFGGAAAGVVRPGSGTEVAGVLAACASAGIGVVPQGGNTGLVGGGVPRGGEVVLSLARLTDIGPLDPVARQITAGAGVTPAALAAALRGSGLALGVDFGARDAATLGGMVATDAGGAQVLRHGTMRARVAGLEAVLADGRVLRRLSGLPKDNAGYDLPQLLVGSEGTLAVITAVRLALVDEPHRLTAALLGMPSIGASVELVAGARRMLPGLQAAEVFDDAAMDLVMRHLGLPQPLAERHAVYVLVETDDDVDALAAALGDAGDVAVADDTARRQALWRYREALNPAVNAAGIPHKLDVSVPLPATAAFAAEARAADRVARGQGDPLGSPRRRQPARQRARPAAGGRAGRRDRARAGRRVRRLDQRGARRRRGQAALPRADAQPGGARPSCRPSSARSIRARSSTRASCSSPGSGPRR